MIELEMDITQSSHAEESIDAAWGVTATMSGTQIISIEPK